MGAILCAQRFDRISRNAHTVSGLLQEGIRLRPADMPDADDMMVRIHAAVAQRERELIGERTRVALAAAKVRNPNLKLGGKRDYVPPSAPDASLASAARIEKADRAACRVLPLINELRQSGATSLRQIAAGLNAMGHPTPRGKEWDATAVSRVLARSQESAAAAASATSKSKPAGTCLGVIL